MAESVALILCAGEVQQISGVPKQILPCGSGEVFVSRIVRQARERHTVPIVVAHHAKIVQAAGAASYDPGVTLDIEETLAATVHLWRKRTFVLLGDTCYSRSCADDIFFCEDNFAAWGFDSQIFALAFSRGYWKEMLAAIDDALLAPKMSLSQFLINVVGLDLAPYVPKQTGASALHVLYRMLVARNLIGALREVTDYTTDVDTLAQYADFRTDVLCWRIDDL